MLNKLKQGGGSLLDRMRGREEEKSDPLTRTIRDRWVLRSEKVWWEGSGRQKGDETNHQLGKGAQMKIRKNVVFCQTGGGSRRVVKCQTSILEKYFFS